jgi:hypothetical protein
MATPPGWGNPQDQHQQHPQYQSPPPYPPFRPSFPYQYSPYPQPGLIPLRPLGFGELIRAGLSGIRRYPAAVLGPNALVVAASLLLGGSYLLVAELVSGPTVNHVFSLSGKNMSGIPDRDIITTLAWFGGGLLLMALCYLALLVCSQTVSSTAAGRGAVGRAFRFGEAVHEARTHGWRLARLYLLVGLVLAVLTAIGFVPGPVLAQTTGDTSYLALLVLVIPAMLAALFLSVRWKLAGPALALERQPVLEALRRSWRLTSGIWWRTFGLQIVCSLLTYAATQIIQIPVSIIASLAGVSLGATSTHGTLTASGSIITFAVPMAIAIALETVTLPFQQLPSTFLYVDQRIRRESLDTALAAEAGITWPPPATDAPESRESPDPQPPEFPEPEEPEDSRPPTPPTKS